MQKKFKGNHWIVGYRECFARDDSGKLVIDSPEVLKKIMVRAAENIGANVLNSFCYQFSPQGVTCLIAISESHLSAHSWPEERYLEFDFNTCNPEMNGEELVKEIGKNIGAVKYSIRKLIRYTDCSAVEDEKNGGN
jgi:S-adenosylmethionine decarboxylase proenzyme